MPNYQKLKTMVKRSINQKLRSRNFDARHGNIEAGALVKNRKGSRGVEGGKRYLLPVETKKANVRRQTSALSGMRMTIMHKKPNPNAATPSEPSTTRGGSVSSKSGIKGKCNPGIILRQPCGNYLKGTCTRSPSEYWHAPECQFYKNELGCREGDKCLFPHHKVDEQPNKKPKKSDHSPKKEEKATTRMQWLL